MECMDCSFFKCRNQMPKKCSEKLHFTNFKLVIAFGKLVNDSVCLEALMFSKVRLWTDGKRDKTRCNSSFFCRPEIVRDFVVVESCSKKF